MIAAFYYRMLTSTVHLYQEAILLYVQVFVLWPDDGIWYRAEVRKVCLLLPVGIDMLSVAIACPYLHGA